MESLKQYTVGLLGKPGCGKTALVRMLASRVFLDEYKPSKVTVSYVVLESQGIKLNFM